MTVTQAEAMAQRLERIAREIEDDGRIGWRIAADIREQARLLREKIR